MERKNFYISTEAQVTKIIIENNVATAVEVYFAETKTKKIFKAKKEIIISAGSLMSPAILMHSGVGPQEQLEKFKIPIVKHLPGVGNNLQE